MYTSEQLKWAETLFNYLTVSDPIEPADIIIGFGHFDMAIPEKCYQLYKQGYGKKILFNGGVGSGSGSFTRPEAIEFEEYIKQKDHRVLKDVLVEPDSTNTGENVMFSIRVMAEESPDFNFSNQIHSAILITNSFRQRRVALTMRKHLPHVKVYNAVPATTMQKEIELFGKENQDIIPQMPAELDRILLYPAKGFIVADEVPDKVVSASHALKQSLQQMGIPVLQIK